MCYPEPLEVIEYRDCEISIFQDEDAANPRKEFDRAGLVSFWTRKTDHLSDNDAERFDDAEDFLSWNKRENKGGCFLPLWYNDERQGSFSSGSLNEDPENADGVIYISRATIEKEWGKRYARKKVAAYLTVEAEEFGAYLTGDVYGFTAIGPDGEDIDGCWGFYGQEYCIEEAKAACDAHLEQEKAA